MNEQGNADEIFGGVTILSGIVGTICGGLFLDYIGASLRNSFKVLNLFVVSCCLLGTGFFLLQSQ